MAALLEVASLVAAYGQVRALWDVSLEVGEGEIVTLLGANGAGKTTTLRVLSGLLRPRSGTVTFAGQRIDRFPPPRIVQAGLVQFPEGGRLWPRMRVLEKRELARHSPPLRAQRHDAMEWVFPLFPRLHE